MDVCIVLGKRSADSRILLAGVDVTSACEGIDVHAHVRDVATRITLHLIARVEITGEVGQLEFVPKDTPPVEGDAD